ncbi:helix-turn-helix domain-containing protein [Glaciecola siphonariae]|uniref:Helix-turn-helix domain-containing protein n=1 Tax=Glaciecola siphonariae TaxID=521012 RepID=A0ABV9LRV1_9ALTE
MARALIIEDNIIIARDLQAILVHLNHEVVGIANNSTRAETLLEDEDVDIAFVDIRIDGEKDGVSLAYFLREINPLLKIVFVTSQTDSPTIERVSSVKPNGFILKPFTEDSIYTALTLALADDRQLPEAGSGQSSLVKASEQANKLDYETISSLENYIQKQLNRDISLKELADLANMSESHFSRKFKSSYGLSPYQYVLNERINEAKRLLRNTHYSLSDIADMVGFSSQAHFNSVFKKTVGITPLKYRKV